AVHSYPVSLPTITNYLPLPRPPPIPTLFPYTTLFRSWFETAAERLGRRWALAESKRCRGLMLAAKGRLDEAAAALERSVRMSESLGQPLVHGRALLAQGTVARRAKRKREADEALGQATEVFERAGMALLAERARA